MCNQFLHVMFESCQHPWPQVRPCSGAPAPSPARTGMPRTAVSRPPCRDTYNIVAFLAHFIFVDPRNF